MQDSQFFNQTILWCRKLFHYAHYLSYSENYSDILFINLLPVSKPSIRHLCQVPKGPICTLPVQKCALFWFTGILQHVWHWNILALIKRLWFLWIPIKLVKEICILKNTVNTSRYSCTEKCFVFKNYLSRWNEAAYNKNMLIFSKILHF